MRLIDFDGVEFKPADEALFIRPIREMFQADKSKKKESFWQQISYLWFICDPRSPYQYLVDESERAAEVKKQEGFPADWEPSDLLRNAMDIYRGQMVTTNSLLLEGMRKGIENVRKFLADVDLFAVDEKTQKPLYQVSTITSALKQVPELAKALAEAEKALVQEYVEDAKIRGTATKAVGEDW